MRNISLFILCFVLCGISRIKAQSPILSADTTLFDYKSDTTYMKMAKIKGLTLEANMSDNSIWIHAVNFRKYVYADLNTRKIITPEIHNLPKSGKDFKPENLISFRNENKLIWFNSQWIFITDTNSVYVKHFKSPFYKYMDKFYNGEKYMKSEFCMDTSVYFSFQTFINKDAKFPFVQKKNDIPAFASYGRMRVSEMISKSKKYPKFDGFIYTNSCNTFRLKPYSHEKSTYPDPVNNRIWFSDPFTTHLISYSTKNNTYDCYPLPISPVKYAEDWKVVKDPTITTSHLLRRNILDTLETTRLTQVSFRYLPESNRIVREFGVICFNDSLLINRLHELSFISGSSESMYAYNINLFTCYQILTLIPEVKIIWQAIVPHEHRMTIVSATDTEITGFKQIPDGDYTAPALIQWKINPSDSGK